MKILKESRIINESAEDTKDKIIEYIDTLSDNEKAYLWNQYCSDVGYSDDAIEYFEEDTINEFFQSPYDALRAAFFGEVSFNHDYFKLNGYGNIVTGYPDDFADWEDVASYAIENEEDFGYDEIRYIILLDEDEDEDEE